MSAQQIGAPGTRNWTAREVARVKPLVFLLALYPLARWIWLGTHDGLSANPPEFLIRSSGIWALVLLGLTLCVTPLRRLLRQPALVRLRRMLGLFAFFYTCLHVLGWAYWERGWTLTSMWADIVQRTFILVGVLAFVPMVALAITSTRGWIHRLGRGWQQLHRSVYMIAILSVWHFWLVRAGKNDFAEPYLYGALLAGLLLIRVFYFYRRRSV
ncbi:sulfite oxidase heme-binding subunit YedZ [Pollutimonas harenae]|uniref:Protein-methionine-sulfoxide reductase heme-binding subunit MsrQ n=1 Tax=Pollutimonas harenae TaxID=657015 RepID=A0A853H4N8_9BURK|nr:protein-methionine-sulfoxide reductase heme-binding subunit MsrQ [Pollutimonas harenae]NYT85523.1 sulfoxide reductase heme-binding subunit YedZ [Pollutimonas harenae]TEA70610.1 sulfoxide reductase heme-binding subunit YedZ [Pollutimonas harenae]